MSAPARRYLLQLRLRLLLGVLVSAFLGSVSGAAAAPAPPPVASAASTAFSLSPGNIRDAYSLPKTGARHQTIAVVSALGDPSVATDLNAYTKRFGIPPCTEANHCFRVLNEDGAASPLPQKDPSGVWLTESSVGVEVARGICQSCSIMLLEARSPSKFDVSTAVNTAARLGATVVETAYEDAPAPDDGSTFGSDYAHPGTVVVSASGDAAYTGLVFFPASMPNVIAVGGTHLDLTPGGGYQDEFAWAATTSGCSPYAEASAWQRPFAASVGCGSKRAIADLAAVADPGMLVHVQDVGSPCGNVFCEADGTSVAAPIIAGMIGLAGSLGSNESKVIYAHASKERGVFRDVTTGDNGRCGKPICQARRGFDGPTGLGTPYGLAAFLASGGALDARHPEFTVTGTNGRLRTSVRWITRLGARNQNQFALTGTVTLWSGARMLASTRLALAPLASTTASLTVASRYRTLLRTSRALRVKVVATIRGPAGRSVKVTKYLQLHAP